MEKNKANSDQATKVTVKRRKKGALIAFIVMTALYIPYSVISNQVTESEIQRIIEMGYLAADYTKEDLGNFCNFESLDLDETFDIVCFWLR
tara:strand:- start:584 stop:856 length:273 start_codon:yes stop_codon:yes gene_type:complete